MATEKKAAVNAIVGLRKDDSSADVQAILFPLELPSWQPEEAREQWLMENDYENNGCEQTDHGYKYQQTPESEFKKDSLHSVPFGDPGFPDFDAEKNGTNDDEPNINGDRKRVVFRMSPSLYEQLRQYADDEDLSTNQLVTRALQKFLNDRNGGKPGTAQTKMQEIRDLKEARDLLDPEKPENKGLIEQLEENVRQCIEEMAGVKKPAQKKKWWEDD